MSEVVRKRARRADAERSRHAVLEAAIRLLDDRPDATLEQMAVAAGVTRQTVYAHFGSRRDLLLAVADELTRTYLAALDSANLDQGPAIDALMRVIHVGSTSARLSSSAALTVAAVIDPAESQAQHKPVVERIVTLARRGQQSGDFDNQVPAEWLAAATIALSHTTAAETAAGRLPAADAEAILLRSVMQIYGVEPCVPRPPRSAP